MIHAILISKQRKEISPEAGGIPFPEHNNIMRVSNFAQHTYKIVSKITSANQGSTVNAVSGGWMNEMFRSTFILFLGCPLIFC